MLSARVASTVIGCLLTLGAAGRAGAQVAIAQQPDPAVWLRGAMERRAHARLDEKALLALGRAPVVAAALREDLGKLDWLVVGAYSYPEQQLDLAYRQEEPCQLEVRRYLADGGELRFTYSASCADREHGRINHLNFSLPPPTKAAVREERGLVYLELEAYGKKELHRVVAYRDGVLVVDISYDGKPRSTRVKFREVRVAMPRGFVWQPG